MQTRKWKLDTDYKYLVEWWKQYDFGIVPKECLPPDGIVDPFVLLDFTYVKELNLVLWNG